MWIVRPQVPACKEPLQHCRPVCLHRHHVAAACRPANGRTFSAACSRTVCTHRHPVLLTRYPAGHLLQLLQLLPMQPPAPTATPHTHTNTHTSTNRHQPPHAHGHLQQLRHQHRPPPTATSTPPRCVLLLPVRVLAWRLKPHAYYARTRMCPARTAGLPAPHPCDHTAGWRLQSVHAEAAARAFRRQCTAGRRTVQASAGCTHVHPSPSVRATDVLVAPTCTRAPRCCARSWVGPSWRDRGHVTPASSQS